MSFPDILSTFQWWTIIFLIGLIFLPLTSLIFSSFFDKGYVFSKIIGIAFISYAVFVLGFLKILPFTEINTILIGAVFLSFNSHLIFKYPAILTSLRKSWKIFLFEEFLFLVILFLWSFIHAHQPEIHGLEKYMDFGFINSILRSEYFPPKDMWFTPFPINYYYFGHLVTAVLTKISFLPSYITFNLMLATIAAFGFTASFSIGANLISKILNNKWKIVGGLLTAFILNFAGNLHTIYLFFKPYQNENPVPFWQLLFSPQTFPNNYWYPNATRFIYNTIHEFPIYSYVVSDLHGHVLDIPFVLLTIALLLSIYFKSQIQNHKSQINLNIKFLKNNKFVKSIWNLEFGIWNLPLISFLLAVMYMTNAWDGLIYFILSSIVIGYLILKSNANHQGIKNSFQIHKLISSVLVLGGGFILFTIPFNLNFKPFASGIGILCAPKFLTNLGSIGPFIFEANHCQHSPIWQLGILYGFFYFWAISFIVYRFAKRRLAPGFAQNDIARSDIFILILIILSTFLIILPEFIYVKDIYPAHYRANTMFKLVYQSFIMLSLSSGYIIIRLFLNSKSSILNHYLKLGYWVIGLLGLLLVFLYPYFSIKSYFGDWKVYSGLNGISYLKSLYPSDYAAILWINKNIKGQPVLLEAQGDSYTDYARVSANTGLPTVLGWTVHEWLWRGSYDIPSPRIAEITKMYESENLEETKILLKKYNTSLVFTGDLEKQKYPNLNIEKFKSLGKIIYQKEGTKIFEVNLR